MQGGYISLRGFGQAQAALNKGEAEVAHLEGVFFFVSPARAGQEEGAHPVLLNPISLI